jgi:hypothetical protein
VWVDARGGGSLIAGPPLSTGSRIASASRPISTRQRRSIVYLSNGNIANSSVCLHTSLRIHFRPPRAATVVKFRNTIWPPPPQLSLHRRAALSSNLNGKRSVYSRENPKRSLYCEMSVSERVITYITCFFILILRYITSNLKNEKINLRM